MICLEYILIYNNSSNMLGNNNDINICKTNNKRNKYTIINYNLNLMIKKVIKIELII